MSTNKVLEEVALERVNEKIPEEKGVEEEVEEEWVKEHARQVDKSTKKDLGKEGGKSAEVKGMDELFFEYVKKKVDKRLEEGVEVCVKEEDEDQRPFGEQLLWSVINTVMRKSGIHGMDALMMIDGMTSKMKQIGVMSLSDFVRSVFVINEKLMKVGRSPIQQVYLQGIVEVVGEMFVDSIKLTTVVTNMVEKKGVNAGSFNYGLMIDEIVLKMNIVKVITLSDFVRSIYFIDKRLVENECNKFEPELLADIMDEVADIIFNLENQDDDV
jgi:hypothetical protein